MKKVKSFSICILLTCASILTTSCVSKSKLIHEEVQHRKEKIDSVAHKSEIKIIQKDSFKEEEYFENTGEGEILIERPDGTKVHIPNKGSFKRSKKLNEVKILETERNSLNIKKKTVTKTKEEKRDKQVQREPFKMPWWIWVGLIAGGLLYWESTKRG